MGLSSDRNRERRWHLIAAWTVGALVRRRRLVGRFFIGRDRDAGCDRRIYGSRAAFWPMPSIFLTGTAARRDRDDQTPQVNSALFGPFIVGWIKDSTGSFEPGCMSLPPVAEMRLITFFAARAAGDPAA